MKLHLLRMFTEVAEQMSFSCAAEALYVSQPAVSKAVKELENQLGVPLFERGAGKLTLTEAGALLAERGRGYCPLSALRTRTCRHCAACVTAHSASDPARPWRLMCCPLSLQRFSADIQVSIFASRFRTHKPS